MEDFHCPSRLQSLLDRMSVLTKLDSSSNMAFTRACRDNQNPSLFLTGCFSDGTAVQRLGVFVLLRQP